MAPLRLSLACWDYDRTRRLTDGTVAVPGIDLNVVTLPVEEIFHRMLRHREFDVAEMSLSSYVLSLCRPDPPFVAIPVFPSRMFRHSAVYVPAGSDVEAPADLVDGLVGVPEYQMTAAVWIRGIFDEHHGLPADRVRYRTGGLHDAGRTEKLVLDLPERFDVAPIPAGATLAEMLAAGELAALYTARAPRTFRPRDPTSPVRRLFPAARAAERAYFESTQIFPIMHTVVIRREVYERDRWVARALLDAFDQAKAMAMSTLDDVTSLATMLPWSATEAEETRALMGVDWWPYGVASNRHTLEAFLRYSQAQGLADRALEVEELFAPETHDQVLI